MASDRIRVMEDFISRNDLPVDLASKALGNAYYIAARLAFFDSKVNGRQLVLKAFKYRRGWPEEARIHVVVYLLLMPISSFMFELFPSIKAKIGSY